MKEQRAECDDKDEGELIRGRDSKEDASVRERTASWKLQIV